MKTILFLLSIFIACDMSAQENKPRTMQDTLKEVVIKSKSAKRVLHSAKEYVVDYDFVADKVLVASYSSANNAKLFLLSKDGDTSSLVRLPESPDALYQGCVGRHYCVGYDELYPLLVDTGQIAMDAPYDLSALKELQECKFATKDRFYYKMINQLYLYILYGYVNAGDTKFHPILNFEDIKNLKSIFDSHSSMAPTLRLMFLREALAYLDQPLFMQKDTLIAFDLRDKFIRCYDLDGRLLNEVPIHFKWKNVQRIEVIEDIATKQFYLHRFENNIEHSISQIDMSTGELHYTINIEKTFPSKLKVHNNDVYFLWQNPAEPTTQQLYVQRGF